MGERKQDEADECDVDLVRRMALAGQLAWYTTELAALYMHKSEKALQMSIARGLLKPDTFGGRGRSKTHMFKRETLDRFLANTPSDGNAA